MRALTLGKSTAVFGAAMLMVFGSTACATKKYVRQTVGPVEARASTLEKKTADQASAIGELENNLSRTDERAAEANRNAQAAGQSAERANQAALEARNRADQAASAAEQNASRLNEVVGNLNNYQLVTTEAVLFPVNKWNLTRAGKEQLDQAVSNIKNNNDFVLEIRGFTDRTGSRDSNLVLSQKRADAVVRYLTTQHDIPLRRIHVLGVGVEDDARETQRTRAARREARRVEVKVFARNLGGTMASNQGAQGSSMNSGSMNNNSSMNSGTQGNNASGNTMSGNDQMRSRTETGATSSTSPRP